MRVVSRVQMLASAANAPIVAAALDDRIVQIWGLNTGKQIAEFNTVFEGGGRRLALNPTGGICVAASWKKGKRDGVACYDLRSNQIKWHRPDIPRIQGLRFSAAGDGIWCWIERGSVQRLDAASGSTQGSMRGVEDVYESPYSNQRLEIRGPALWVKGENEFQVARLSHAVLDAVFGTDTLCLTEASGSVRCLECGTGKERWRFQPAPWTHVVALSYRVSDDSFYAVQRIGMPGQVNILFRLSQETGAAVEVCHLTSSLVCFGAEVIVNSNGEVISLRAGEKLKQLAFPERQIPDPPPPVTEPLLHFAARYGTEKTIRDLIASGSDVNIAGDDGCTALHVAAMKGRLDVISILLELGGDPNIKNALGETAAQSAERAGHSEMAAILRMDSAR